MTSDAFPNRRRVGGAEGGTIYAAEKDGKFYAFTDESASMDLLSDEEAADLEEHLAGRAPAEFGTAEGRDRYLIDRYGAFLGRGVELWPADSGKRGNPGPRKPGSVCNGTTLSPSCPPE